MPMPHRTQMQIIKRRLAGKDGTARVRELRAILAELPNYRNGPYADIRKWVHAQIADTRQQGRVLRRDSIEVPHQGAAQVALVGAPNAGKSSLLQALSDVQVKTADYAFTTTRPVAAVTRVQGVLVQLVEIPGLIAGAHADRGGGRALLGVLRGADAMVLCHPADAAFEQLDVVRTELSSAGIELPAIVAITKMDNVSKEAIARLLTEVSHLDAVAVSILDDASLDVFLERVWRLTGLQRIYLMHEGKRDDTPLALAPPVNVLDVADAIHHDLAARCQGARIWGPSAHFSGERVGRLHPLVDGDAVEIIG